MNKLYVCLVLLMTSIVGFAKNDITVSSSSGHPGEEVTVSIQLTNTDNVSAVQIELPLNENLSYVDGSAQLNTLRRDDHDINVATTTNGMRLIVYSLGLKNLKGQAGELCSFRLKLKREPAKYSLRPEVVLTSASGAKLSCTVFEGSVTLLAPKIELSTTSVDFGNNPIRSTYSRQVTVRNVGTETLHINEIAVSEAVFATDKTSMVIAPGQQSSLAIKYSPTTKGKSEGSVSISSDAVNGKLLFSLLAQAYTVNELHVHNAMGLSGEVITVSMKMNNMEGIAAVQCSFDLPKELEYVSGSVMSKHASHTAYSSYSGNRLTLMMYSPLNTTIPAGEADLLTFQLRIKGKSGTYMLQPIDVVLGNEILENVVSSSGGADVLVQSAKISAPSTLDFGDCDITKPATARYTIKNVGEVPLVISKVIFKDEGYSLNTTLPLTIQPATSGDIIIEFQPQEGGREASSFNLYTNDPDNSTVFIETIANVLEPNVVSLSGNVNVNELTGQIQLELNNYSRVSAFQMDITCSEGISIQTAKTQVSSRLDNHNLTCTKIADGVYRLMCFSLSNSSISGNMGALCTLAIEADSRENLAGKLLTIDNIIIGTPNGQNTSTTSAVEFVYEDTSSKYDVNLDGVVDISDAVVVINAYLNNTKTPSYDVNDDNVIDISDAVRIIKEYLSRK